MGEDRGNRLKLRALYPIQINSRTTNISSIINRWQIGCRITPELREKTKEALLILDKMTNAAETDKRYTNARYQGKASREKMREAELLRAGSMLHAIEVLRLMVLKAFEQDDPGMLNLAIGGAWIMNDHILDRGFFKLDAPIKPITPSPFKKTELNAETVEGLAMGLRQKIERTYNLFVYTPLAKTCKDMGILLCPFEQLAEDTPLPPTLNVSNA